MRRILIPAVLVGLAVAGLWLSTRDGPPEVAGPPRTRAANTTTVGPPATPGSEAPAVASSPADAVGFEGRLWTDGGVPVADLPVRLETETGTVVARVRTGDGGRFGFAPDVRTAAGAPAWIRINPDRGQAAFESLRVRLDPETARRDLYVGRAGIRPGIDVEIEIRNALSPEQGGGPVRVELQDLEGEVIGTTLEPGESRTVIRRRPAGVYAISARQGRRVAALPPAELDPARFPVLLVLEEGGTLVGRVRTPGGDPAAGAVLRLIHDIVPDRILRGDFVYRAASVEHVLQTVAATAGADGAFRIEGLAPVRYDLAVLHDSGSRLAEVVVPHLGEVVDLGELTLASATGTIRARLELPGGLPDGPGEPQVAVVGLRHRVRREAAVDAAPGEVRVGGLPPDAYAVVLVRARALPGGRGRFERFVSRFELVEVRAGGNHPVTLRPRP